MRRVAAFILNHLLSNFIEPVTSDQIVTKLLNGETTLSQIEIKRTALSAVGIPIKIRKGTINQVHAKIPFMNFSTTPTLFTVDGLFILGHFSDKVWLDSELVTKFSSYSEIDKIADERNTSKNNVMMSYVASIANNLMIQMDNIHIRIEMEIEGVKMAGGIICRKFEVNSPEKGERQEKMFKKATMSGFSIYLDANHMQFHGDRFEDDMRREMFSEHQYILKDLEFVTTIEIPQGVKDEPLMLLLSVGEVKSMFDASQWKCLNLYRRMYNRLKLRSFACTVGRPNVECLEDPDTSKANAWWGYTYRMIRKRKFPSEFVPGDALKFFAAKKELYENQGILGCIPFFGKKDRTFEERKSKYGLKVASMLRCYDFAKTEIEEVRKKRAAVENLDTSVVELPSIDFDTAMKQLRIDVKCLEALLRVDGSTPLTCIRFGNLTGDFFFCQEFTRVQQFQLQSFEVTNEVSLDKINFVTMENVAGRPCLSCEFLLNRNEHKKNLQIQGLAPLVYADFLLIDKVKEFFEGSTAIVELPREKTRDQVSSKIIEVMSSHHELCLEAHFRAPVVTIPFEDNVNIVLGSIDIKSEPRAHRDPKKLEDLYDSFVMDITGFTILLNGQELCRPITTRVSLDHRFVILKSIPEFKAQTRISAIEFNITREQYVKLLKLLSAKRHERAPVRAPVERADASIKIADDSRDLSISLELVYDHVSIKWYGDDPEFVCDDFSIHGMKFSVMGLGNELNLRTEIGSMLTSTELRDSSKLELFRFGSSNHESSFTCKVRSVVDQQGDFLDVNMNLGAFWLNLDIPWIFHMVKGFLPPDKPDAEAVSDRVETHRYTTLRRLSQRLRSGTITSRRREAIERQLRSHLHLKFSLHCQQAEIKVPNKRDISLKWESITVKTGEEVPRSIENPDSFYDVIEFDWKQLNLQMGSDYVIPPVDSHLEIKVLFVKASENQALVGFLDVSSIGFSFTRSHYSDFLSLLDMLKGKLESVGYTRKAPKRGAVVEDRSLPSLSFNFKFARLYVSLNDEDNTPLDEAEIKGVEGFFMQNETERSGKVVVDSVFGRRVGGTEHFQILGAPAFTLSAGIVDCRDSQTANLDVRLGDLEVTGDVMWVKTVLTFLSRPKLEAISDEPPAERQVSEKPTVLGTFLASVNSVKVALTHASDEVSVQLRESGSVPGLKVSVSKTDISISIGSLRTLVDIDLMCDIVNELLASGIAATIWAKIQEEEREDQRKLSLACARSFVAVEVDRKQFTERLLFEFELSLSPNDGGHRLDVPYLSGYFASDPDSRQRAFLDSLSFSYTGSETETANSITICTQRPFQVNFTTVDIVLATRIINAIPYIKSKLLIDWESFDTPKKSTPAKKPTQLHIDLSQVQIHVFANNQSVGDAMPLMRYGVDSISMSIMVKDGFETGIPIRLKALEVFNFSTGVFDMAIEPMIVTICMRIVGSSTVLDVRSDAMMNINMSLNAIQEMKFFLEDVVRRIKENDVAQAPISKFAIINKTGYDTELCIDGTMYSFKHMESITNVEFNSQSVLQFVLDRAEPVRPSELTFPVCICKNIFVFQTITHESRNIIFSSSLIVSNHSNLHLVLVSKKDKRNVVELVEMEPWKEQAVPFSEQCDGTLAVIEKGQLPNDFDDDCLFTLRRDTTDVITRAVVTSIGLIPFTIRIKARTDSPVYEVRISPVVVIRNRLPCSVSVALDKTSVLSIESGSEVFTHVIKANKKHVTGGISLDSTYPLAYQELPLDGEVMVPVMFDVNRVFVTWSARKSANRVQITIYAPAIMYNMTNIQLNCMGHYNNTTEDQTFVALNDKGVIWGTKDYLGQKRNIPANIVLQADHDIIGGALDCKCEKEGILMVKMNDLLAVPLAYIITSAEPFAPSKIVTFFNYIEVENRLDFQIQLQPLMLSSDEYVNIGEVCELDPGQSVIIQEATEDLLFGFFTHRTGKPVPLSLAVPIRHTLISPDGHLVELCVKEKGRFKKAWFKPAVLPQPLMIFNRLDNLPVVFCQQYVSVKHHQTVEPNSTIAFGMTNPLSSPQVQLNVGSTSCSISFDKVGEMKRLNYERQLDIYVVVSLNKNGTRSIVVFSDPKLTSEYYPPVSRLRFVVNLPGICVSLINDTPRELALLVLHKISASVTGQEDVVDIQLQVQKLTFEDLHPNAVYKVALLGKQKQGPFISINAKMFRTARAMTSFSQLSVSFGKLKAFAHTHFLSDIYAFVTSVIPSLSSQKLEPPEASHRRPGIAKIPLSVRQLTISTISVSAVVLTEPRVRFYSRMLPKLSGVPTMSDPIRVSIDEIVQKDLSVTYGYLGRLSKTIIDQVKSQMTDVYLQAFGSIMAGVIKKRTKQNREEMSRLRNQKAFIHRQISTYDRELADLQLIITSKRPLECLQCIYRNTSSAKLLALTQSFIIEGDTSTHKANPSCVTDLASMPTRTGSTITLPFKRASRTFECASESEAAELIRDLTSRIIITLRLQGAKF